MQVYPFKKLSFHDVSTENPAYISIAKMVQLGYMDAPNKKFEPTKPLKRGEMAMLFAGGFGITAPDKPIIFKDVPAGSKYEKSIQALASTRVISTNGPFNPEKNLTRAQFASVLAKLLKQTSK